MTGAKRIVVVGASGFVGSATVRALLNAGHNVSAIKAPRLPAVTEEGATTLIDNSRAILDRLVGEFRSADAVVNTAGIAAATSGSNALVAANGALPGLIATAVRNASVARFVHVSSAAVQGRRPELDDTAAYDDFSAYARSKRLGEQLALQYTQGTAVVYRPPGVHGPDRSVTRFSARVAASPLASVARPKDSPSPQALIDNVGAAIAYLATCTADPPRYVIHPWEGVTTADVHRLLGGREPVAIPRIITRALLGIAGLAGGRIPWVAGNARRLEMMWHGQRQAESWLTKAGWTPPKGRDAWEELGRAVRATNDTDAGERETHT